MWAVVLVAMAGFTIFASDAPRAAGVVLALIATFFVWMSLREPVALEIDEHGVAVRLPLGTRRLRWDELAGCGFRQVSVRESTWIEAGLETASGWMLFVPAGGPAFLAVAIVRRKRRALGLD